MPSNEKFSLLRNILKALGLSSDATDDIVDRILGFLSDREPKPAAFKFPYYLRDNLVTKAEHNFYMVVRSIMPESAVVLAKVSLGDLFYVKSHSMSEFRIYTNKIDRKHVDFLLCDAKTMRPIVGIELDDKSHQRDDRMARDEFVEHVFQAARLPLIRFPVKFSYSTAEITAVLARFLNVSAPVLPVLPESKLEDAPPIKAPQCPKCGKEMVLRTAKSGVNQGKQFWGCPAYPDCSGIMAKAE